MKKQWNMEKREMQERHVLFQEEDKDGYIETMLSTLPYETRKEERTDDRSVRRSIQERM